LPKSDKVFSLLSTSLNVLDLLTSGLDISESIFFLQFKVATTKKARKLTFLPVFSQPPWMTTN